MALDHYYEHDNANVHRGIHELSNRATAAFEASRTRTAKFLNAYSENEIIFTRGTTEGINLALAPVMRRRNIRAGDKILLTEMEHHSNLVPWQLLAERAGAQLLYVPITGDDGLLDLSRLDTLLTREVKLFAFTHISNSLGTVNPVAELCARAQIGRDHPDRRRAKRRAPAGQLDVQSVGLRFPGFFRSQNLRGPTGIGVLWGREEILNSMPPYQGGGRNDPERGFSTVHLQTRAANGFEAGFPGHVRGHPGLHAVAGLPRRHPGRENIFHHDQELAAHENLRTAFAHEQHSPLWTENGARELDQFSAQRCPRARRGDGGGPMGCCPARAAIIATSPW